MATRSVDAVIVGSGAAGSLIAAKLAQAGKQVLVLEAGPERRFSDLVSSQIWARRIKWADPGILTTGPDPESVGFGSGWGTGGAALHHYGCWFRHHPEDFEMKSRFGKGLDWPISYEDLRPWYDRVQAEVGLSGDAAKEVWRPAGEPYPMPPLPVFNQGLVIARGSRSSAFAPHLCRSRSTPSSTTAGPRASSTAGATPAARPARSRTRSRSISPRRSGRVRRSCMTRRSRGS